jgi:predicted nucleotidyltransferase
MKEEIFKRELDRIVDISKEFGAKKVLLFGSCVEDISAGRDIDVAVSGIKPEDFFKFYGKVSMEVENEVDIVDLDDVREHLYKRILSKGKILYERGV